MPMQLQRWLVSLLILGMLMTSCTPDQAVTQPSPTDRAVETPTTPPAAESPQLSGLPRLNGAATVELIVNGSPIVIEVNGKDAPITAGNFVDLVKRGVYDGLVFHRVVRSPKPFVVQGGDPQSKNPKVPAQQLGTGSFIDPATSQPRFIPLEITPEKADKPLYSQPFADAGLSTPPKLKHTRGAVAMARSMLPDSASSQFYITLSELDFLDGNYAVFGYVTQGMDVVDKIQQGDRIESAKVTKGLENLK